MADEELDEELEEGDGAKNGKKFPILIVAVLIVVGPTLTGRYSNFVVGGLVLFTAPNTNLERGDIFFSAFNKPMICLENADEESIGRTQQCFCVKILNFHSSWDGPTDVIDLITGLAQTTSMENMGDIYGSLEDDGQALSVTGINFPKYKFITNVDLHLNDVIGKKYVVARVDNFLGVTIADVKLR